MLRGGDASPTYTTISQPMPIPNRVVAALCIVAVAFAAVLGVSTLDHAWFEGEWVLLPHVTFVPIAPPIDVATEQPLALLSLLPSRAPPSGSLA
jgi:hypothetical protein